MRKVGDAAHRRLHGGQVLHASVRLVLVVVRDVVRATDAHEPAHTIKKSVGTALIVAMPHTLQARGECMVAVKVVKRTLVW
jgi:hypothetical protein